MRSDRCLDCCGRGIARALCLVALALVSASAMSQDISQSCAPPAMLASDTHIWVNHDYSIEVSDTTQVNAAAPSEFHRDLAFPGPKLKPGDVFLIAASENDETVNADVVPLGDGLRINVHPNRSTGPRKFEIDYRVLYLVVDHGKLDCPLTLASNRLPLHHASLRVTLPEETPSNQIQAKFQLDGTQVADGEHHVKTRVFLDWPAGIAPAHVLRAVITFPIVDEASSFVPPKVPAWMFNGDLWLAVLAFYYLVAKIIVSGGGGEKLVIVEYEAQTGWSAGAVRLLWHGSWDRRCFATGVLGVAAKGGLTLGKQADGAWVATHAGDDHIPTLTADERALRSALFVFGHTASF